MLPTSDTPADGAADAVVTSAAIVRHHAEVERVAKASHDVVVRIRDQARSGRLTWREAHLLSSIAVKRINLASAWRVMRYHDRRATNKRFADMRKGRKAYATV